MSISRGEIRNQTVDADPTLLSLPSDEWGRRSERGGASTRLNYPDDTAGRSKSRLLTKGLHAGGGSEEEEESTRQSGTAKSSYISNQSNSFAGYLSHLIPGKAKSFTTGTDTRAETRTETRASERSSHSRCFIENTESIQDRRDDDDDARHREHNDDNMSSVEEISQISDITMDIRTVIAESKFGTCTTLPTISEAKRYNPAVCVSPMSMQREPDYATDEPKTVRNDMIDFVFELVEDAFCTPLNGSKADRKKAFSKAFQEESIKISRTNSLVDAFQTSSSKHSRSNRTPRRSGNGHIIQAASNCTQLSPTLSTKPAVNGVTVPISSAPSVPSLTRNDPTFVIVDRPPSPTPTSVVNDKIKAAKRTSSATVDEEQTLDWSKIMSFAERQLEGDDKSVFTNTDSRVGRLGRASRRSFFHDNNSTNGDIKPNNTLNSFATAKSKVDLASTDAKAVSSSVGNVGKECQQDKLAAYTSSNSASTHATAGGASSSSDGSAAVQELRQLSAMDSSSFEEEPRLLLTSLLLRLVRHLVPFLKNDVKNGHQPGNASVAGGETNGSSSHLTHENYSDENIIFKALRYAAFILAFVFWPEGIPRRRIEYPPLPRKAEKPSLLKLVFEAPDEEQQ
jgi:hypothetical protein